MTGRGDNPIAGRGEIVRAPTATKLADCDGKVVICGSHGGALPGGFALLAGVRAIVLNDAGIGRNEAGIAGLALCERYRVPAAAVAHTSCRIGDADDMAARGVISHANNSAQALGVESGMACVEAAERLAAAPLPGPPPALSLEERRKVTERGRFTLVQIDSASMVRRGEDDGRIVVTGSHGGLVGGDPAMAIQAEPLLAAFNDAGVGADEAGTTRLPALQQRGIAAVCVSHDSAEIGSSVSTYENGLISHVNTVAASLGATPGMRLKAFVEEALPHKVRSD